MRKLRIIEQKRLHIRPTILDVPAQSLRAREAEWELGTFATDNEFFADEFNMTEICSRRVITVASRGFGTPPKRMSYRIRDISATDSRKNWTRMPRM
jgi:hypothetical protein